MLKYRASVALSSDSHMVAQGLEARLCRLSDLTGPVANVARVRCPVQDPVILTGGAEAATEAHRRKRPPAVRFRDGNSQADSVSDPV